MGFFEKFAGQVIPLIDEQTPAEFDQARLDAVRQEIENKENTLAKWSEDIGIQFEQEPHALKELRDLQRIRARREALETEEKLLNEIVELLQ